MVTANTGIIFSMPESSMPFISSQENALAAWCLTPTLWSIFKLYFLSRHLDLPKFRVASAKFKIHLKAWWLVLTVNLVPSNYDRSRTIAQKRRGFLDVFCRDSFRGPLRFSNNDQSVCRHYGVVSVEGLSLSVDHRHMCRGYIIIPSLERLVLVEKRAFLVRSTVQSSALYSILSTPLIFLFNVGRLTTRQCEQSLRRIYRRHYTTRWRSKSIFVQLVFSSRV